MYVAPLESGLWGLKEYVLTSRTRGALRWAWLAPGQEMPRDIVELPCEPYVPRRSVPEIGSRLRPLGRLHHGSCLGDPMDHDE